MFDKQHGLNIFNKLYDYFAFRHTRFIHLEPKDGIGIDAAALDLKEQEKRKSSRKSLLLYIGVPAMALVLVGGFIASSVLSLLFFISISAAIDFFAQAVFYLKGINIFQNRKLCPLTFTSTILMTLAWLESIINTPYYLYKKLSTHAQKFDDIIHIRAAYGRLAGGTVVIAAILTLTLLANPFTGLPFLALMAAISATIATGLLLIKACEFIGRLSGAFKTRQLAVTAQAHANISEQSTPLHIRSTREVTSKVFKELLEPIAPTNKKTGATIIKECSGSMRKRVVKTKQQNGKEYVDDPRSNRFIETKEPNRTVKRKLVGITPDDKSISTSELLTYGDRYILHSSLKEKSGKKFFKACSQSKEQGVKQLKTEKNKYLTSVTDRATSAIKEKFPQVLNEQIASFAFKTFKT